MAAGLADSVNSKVTYLVCGESPGSKLEARSSASRFWMRLACSICGGYNGVIIEIVNLEAKAGQSDAMREGLRQARGVIPQSPGYLGSAFHQSIERPSDCPVYQVGNGRSSHRRISQRTAFSAMAGPLGRVHGRRARCPSLRDIRWRRVTPGVRGDGAVDPLRSRLFGVAPGPRSA